MVLFRLSEGEKGSSRMLSGANVQKVMMHLWWNASKPFSWIYGRLIQQSIVFAAFLTAPISELFP